MNLAPYEAVLGAYASGSATFADVEAVLRGDVRAFSKARVRRWVGAGVSPELIDEVQQVVLLVLWRALDTYGTESGAHTVASWCGSRIEYALRRFSRETVRAGRYVDFDDAAIPDATWSDAGFELAEIRIALEKVKDDGVRAYVLAALDTSEEVVARIADDAALVARLGWSDVAMGARAARKRAVRNGVVREAIGGV